MKQRNWDVTDNHEAENLARNW